MPGLSDRLAFAFLNIRDFFLKAISLRYSTFVKTFKVLPPGYIEWSSKIRAKRIFFYAQKHVPAYKKFLKNQGLSLECIPETDKPSYIDSYTIKERCLYGKIPKNRVNIDESSGSTGTPSNWIRSLKERKETHRFISYFARHCFGSVDIVINAFSLGAWATGLNMGIALESQAIVKNIGPDLDKIFGTLKFIGPKYKYLILGYPPFLKLLIDTAHQQGFSLNSYQLHGLVGGEGMSEGLRQYLLKTFQSVYSGYGATDLEIGIAGETPLSIKIRQLALNHKGFRSDVFGQDSRLPMVFQYNPLMHYIEVNDLKEIICTITRKTLLSPKIRYNIHDQGGVIRYDRMIKIVKKFSKDFIAPFLKESLKLPFLWIHGRKDYTVSLMGANIYPENIESYIYSDSKLSSQVHSFCQYLVETDTPHLEVNLEVRSKENLSIKQITKDLVDHLCTINLDFKEAIKEYPSAMIPTIKLYALNEGPFHHNQIKHKRILT